MNVKLLIDGIMQQTTLLIGQLSTAAGLRAPLSHLADRVFVELAQELESQGVARRVAADMFGMALRSYQKKLRRLTESAGHPDRTLWQAVLDYLGEHDGASKRDLVSRFRFDGEREVGAVLSDLVRSGLVYHSGQGELAVYGLTTAADRQRLLRDDELESVLPLVWATVHQTPGATEQEVVSQVGLAAELVRAAIAELVREGTLRWVGEGDAQGLRAAELVVPLGAARGWEIAVFDHFRAVVNAIAAKVRSGESRAEADDTVGGATLSFDLGPGHPHEARVKGLLAETRARAGALWSEVEAYNQRHPIEEDQRERVFFYVGQYVEETRE